MGPKTTKLDTTVPDHKDGCSSSEYSIDRYFKGFRIGSLDCPSWKNQ